MSRLNVDLKHWNRQRRRIRAGFGRPGESVDANLYYSGPRHEPERPDYTKADLLEDACSLIESSVERMRYDNRASGASSYGRDGRKRLYQDASVIYSDERNAYILRPSLQPSAYYGRRPLANYIRKSRAIGIPVCRGFDQEKWDRINTSKVTFYTRRRPQCMLCKLKFRFDLLTRNRARITETSLRTRQLQTLCWSFMGLVRNYRRESKVFTTHILLTHSEEKSMLN